MRGAEEECGIRKLRRAPQEIAKGCKQLPRLFNIRYVTAVIQREELGMHRPGDGLRALQRDGILEAVDDEGGAAHVGEAAREIELAEALPDRLLHASGDTERRQVGGAMWVGEVAGDAQLEGPLAIRAGIAFPEAGSGEVGPEFPDARAR